MGIYRLCYEYCIMEQIIVEYSELRLTQQL